MAVRRLFSTIALVALTTVGCTGGGDAEASEVQPTATSVASAAEATTTAVTAAATTTLSEQVQVEADVAQLVTDFWLTDVDTSTGELGLQHTTGPLAERIAAAAESLEADGRVLRQTGGQRIEIISVDVNLAAGAGEVKACRGSSAEVIDAETLERVGEAADPDYLTTSVYLVVKSAEGWKISEIFASSQSASPEICELEG